MRTESGGEDRCLFASTGIALDPLKSLRDTQLVDDGGRRHLEAVMVVTNTMADDDIESCHGTRLIKSANVEPLFMCVCMAF